MVSVGDDLDGIAARPAASPAPEGGRQPQATIVISYRERWGLTPRTVRSILDNSDRRHPIWFLDSGMPDRIRTLLAPLAEAGSVRIVDVGRGTLPNDGRRAIIPLLETPYVVFIDNDVVVTPGWLDNLLACAEETGAGIVGPVYLWGIDGKSDLVHMAGGDLAVSEEGGRLRMYDHHRHSMKKASEVVADMPRQTCDFAEYHCMLMSRDVYSAEGVFDPDISTVNEHIHASLVAREMGYATWLEPTAFVHYLAFSPWSVGDLAGFRRRWDFAVAESSLKRFAERWNVVDDEPFRAGIRSFLMKHHSVVDLLEPRPRAAITRDRMMGASDLAQNFSGLAAQANLRGFSSQSITELARAHRAAIELSNGMYRPCGRPFINHLVGTASVLLFYGCSLRLIIAGMLHSTISHGRSPRSPAEDKKIFDYLRQCGPFVEAAARIALLYTGRSGIYQEAAQSGMRLDDYPMSLAQIHLIEAANDLEMHLSLEVAASSRGDALQGEGLALCRQVVHDIGLPALALAMSQAREPTVAVPKVRFQNDFSGSFIVENGKTWSAVRRPPSPPATEKSA
jgi:hypothetical protein